MGPAIANCSINAEVWPKYEHLGAKIRGDFYRPVYGKGQTPRQCVVFKTNKSDQIVFNAGNLNPPKYPVTSVSRKRK